MRLQSGKGFIWLAGCTAAMVVIVCVIPAAWGSRAHKPIWSKKGATFPVDCERAGKDCMPIRIVSPDGQNSVLVTYESDKMTPT